MNTRSERGFTLAELLVAVTIGAISLSIGVPSYTAFVRNTHQVTSTNELISSLHFARELAITRNARVTLCPSADGATCAAGGAWNGGWIVFVDTNGDHQVNGGETVERAVSKVEAPSVQSVTFGDYLIYRPNGRVMGASITTNTGELTFCDDRGAAHARVLIIDVSGRPRVSDLTANGSTPTCPVVTG